MKAYTNPRNKESRQYTSSSEDLSDAELNDIDKNNFFRPDETCDETTNEIQKNLTSIRNQFNSIATITEHEKVEPENDSSRSEDKHIEDEVISHFGNNINGDEIEDGKDTLDGDQAISIQSINSSQLEMNDTPNEDVDVNDLTSPQETQNNQLECDKDNGQPKQSGEDQNIDVPESNVPVDVQSNNDQLDDVLDDGNSEEVNEEKLGKNEIEGE